MNRVRGEGGRFDKGNSPEPQIMDGHLGLNLQVIKIFILIINLNPLLHFQNYKLAPKTFGFRHQGDPSGAPPNPPANWCSNFAGGFGGPPDAENRRYSELTCNSENEVKG